VDFTRAQGTRPLTRLQFLQAGIVPPSPTPLELMRGQSAVPAMPSAVHSPALHSLSLGLALVAAEEELECNGSADPYIDAIPCSGRAMLAQHYLAKAQISVVGGSSTSRRSDARAGQGSVIMALAPRTRGRGREQSWYLTQSSDPVQCRSSPYPGSRPRLSFGSAP